MSDLTAWLLTVARDRYPERRAELENLTPAPRLMEAWRQVAAKSGVDDWELARAVALNFGLETTDLRTIDAEAVQMLPERLARLHQILPLRDSADGLIVALANPTDEEALSQIRFASARLLRPQIAPPEALDDAITAHYGATGIRASSQLGALRWNSNGRPVEPGPGEESQIADLERRIVQEAIRRRASDVHMQPFSGGALVRCRVDGVLQRLLTLPLHVYETYLRRIKSIARMDPTKDMVPQDGRLSLSYGDRHYELRVSTLPVGQSERLVLRLLDQSRVYSAATMGFAPIELEALQRIVANTSGLFLLTGPTGCGKTTTLYSLLSGLNRGETNILTVEEPVEYRLNGISQVDIDPRTGLTFAAAMRSILRQDPDILLIGEIRDAETADTAVKAALTGHLVFATLHTLDALTAIPRLLDLGVRPSYLADTLVGLMAQRLLRQLCPECRTQVGDALTPMEEAFEFATGMRPPWRATGCEACQYSGYQGRLPVAEILEVGDRLRTTLLDGRADLESLRQAISGARSLEGSAVAAIAAGQTTPEEAFRVLGQGFWNRLHEIGGGGSVAGRLFSGPRQGRAGDGEPPGILCYQPHGWSFVRFDPWVSHAGYRLLPAQALDDIQSLLAGENGIGLVLADISHRREDPRPLLRQLHEHLLNLGLPVIPIVAAGQELPAAFLTTLGMGEPLLAPVEREALLARISRVLKGAPQFFGPPA